MNTKNKVISKMERKFGKGCVRLFGIDEIHVLGPGGWYLLCHTYTPEYYAHLHDIKKGTNA